MKHLLSLCTLLLLSCNDNDDTITQEQDPVNLVLPTVGMSFDWQLDDVTTFNTFNADVIDVDAFSTSTVTVQHFKDQGKIVIAYVSVGSVENFRDDADQFPLDVVGNIYEGFPDKNWIDIRNINAIAPVLRARFDGIEPENINGYQNDTGFPLSEADAIIFSRWLIEEAHSRDLHIGQKNAEELVGEMVDEYD